MSSGQPFVLSIFPGIDLLGRAFEELGFCVVRGPDLLWGGDIHTFHPPAGVFEGVIGGPPCQFASRLRYVNPRAGQKHGNLIPEFERVVVEAKPVWWLMENVPEAPEPLVGGYIAHHYILNNRWFSLSPQNRKRRFSFGTPKGIQLDIIEEALLNPRWEPAVTASVRAIPVTLQRDGKGGHRPKTALSNYSYATKRAFEDMCELQGLGRGFLSDAPFTVTGKCEVVGNAVPMAMGRAVAKAIKQAMLWVAGTVSI